MFQTVDDGRGFTVTKREEFHPLGKFIHDDEKVLVDTRIRSHKIKVN